MFKKSVLEKIRNKPILSKELQTILLTVDELDTEVPTVLTTLNPYFNEACVEYSHKDKAYKPLGNQNKSIFFYSQKGTTTLKESPKRGDESVDDSVEELDTKRKNKFNFCDRATQTANPLHSLKSSQTDVMPQLVYTGNVSEASIVDAYVNKEERAEAERNQENYKETKRHLKKDTKTIDFSQRRRFLRLCERMVDQNLLSDVNIDFSFYDTPCDEFKDKGLGSLLVLWKFSYQPMKKMAVTNLSWNTLYTDMFATSFGSCKCKTDITCGRKCQK